MYSYNDLYFPSHVEKNTRFFALLGFSANGPVQAPFLIKDGVDPYEVLGNSFLAENYLLAKQEGINPLIIRLNGSHAHATLIHEQSGEPILYFESIEANLSCNSIRIHLFPNRMEIQGLRNNQTYIFAQFRNIEELARAINDELYYAKGEVRAKVLNSLPVEGICTTEEFLQFGNGSTGTEFLSAYGETNIEEKRQRQLELLESYLLDQDEDDIYFFKELGSLHIDTLVFSDIPYEEYPLELSRIFGTFAKSKTEEQRLFCSVVLPSWCFQGKRYTEEGEDLFSGAITHLQGINPTSGDNTHLQHVEVVIGMQNSVGAKGIVPSATSYALMRYRLPFYTSATNQTMKGIKYSFNQELQQEEVANLSRSGYIVIVQTINRGFVAYSSQNLYPDYHFQKKPHYLRSLHFHIRNLTSLLNPYIGEPFYLETLQPILEKIQIHLDELKQTIPIYKDVMMEVIQASHSNLKISLYFDLYGEIERVKTSLEYVPQQEVILVWE